MSKLDTWMPLYIGDYLADTMRLSTTEHGAYLLLLMEYWRNGPLPDDDEELADACKMSASDWAQASKRIRSFFTPVDGRLRQKRIDAERKKANEISEKRKSAVAQRADRKSAKDTNDLQEAYKEPTNDLQTTYNCSTNVDHLKTHACARQSQSQSQQPSLTTFEKEGSLRSPSRPTVRQFEPNGFEAWWQKYPRREGKGKAREAYAKALRITSPDALLAALDRRWNADPKYIPLPATWLNGERWLDEIDNEDPVLRAAGLTSRGTLRDEPEATMLRLMQ